MSRTELTQLLEGDMGVALLKESVERIASGQLESVPQSSSNTPYARAVSDTKLAEAAPIDSLEPAVLWDLLNFYGYAPQQWLGVKGWRRRIKWIATDWRSSGLGEPGEPETSMSADADGWTLLERGMRIILMHKNGHIVLGPALLNIRRQKIKVQSTTSFNSRHVSR